MIQGIFDLKQEALWNALKSLPEEIKGELIKAANAMEVPKKEENVS